MEVSSAGGGDGSPEALGTGLTASTVRVLSGAPQTSAYSKDDLQTFEEVCRKWRGQA